MKYSKQREMVLQYLLEKKNHPTAEQIYSELKAVVPSLSLATVYRNLNLLCELGKVQRLDTGETVDRFDADISNHAHFICEVCQHVIDIPSEILSDQSIEKQLGSGYQVSSHKLFIYGICPCCKQLKQ